MEKFIKQNWLKISVTLVVALSLIYYFAIFLPAKPINNFINNLPIGDVDSQKCNQLVNSKTADLVASQSMSNDMYNSAITPQDKFGYAEQLFDLQDSKYIYSHKLCLAYISIQRYNPVFPVDSTSTGMTNDSQIVDLASNEVIAETISSFDTSAKTSWLWGQEQNTPIFIYNFWSKIQEMK